MICTPFTGQSSRGGILVKYSYEYKKECVELYKKGKYPQTPEWLTTKQFHKIIRQWVRLEERHNSEILEHKPQNRKWTAENKYELVARVLAGESQSKVAISAGINTGQINQWVRKYKELGYNGLVTKKGRPPKEPDMKKTVNPAPLTESEREELIRLRAEVERITAENEVIKKEIALREEKAAQLKAKKQQLSKSSKKKDTN